MDTVIVLNSQFYSHFPRQIPKGSVNAEQVEIRLDKSWDGLTVFWHWKNLGTGVEKRDLLKDPAAPNDIPWEVLTDLGELRMGLVGLDGETVIKPTIWLSYGYVSDGVDPEAGDDPQPPTPSWEQQMVEQARVAAEAAEEAKDAAVNAEKAAGQAGPYADEAQKSAEVAKEAQRAASTSAKEAGDAKDQANTASNAAKVHADAAGSAKVAAERAAETAGNAQSGAAQSAQSAANSAKEAETARQEAQQSASIFPKITPEDAGKVLMVSENGEKIVTGDVSGGGKIDDTTLGRDTTWSSRMIVDSLAPAFEVSGPSVTCTPVENYPLNVVSQIEYVQDGEGYPSVGNVRPINGWDGATLTHNNTPITLEFGQTVYGGQLDWTTGELTINWVKYIATGSEKPGFGQENTSVKRWYFVPPTPTLGNSGGSSIVCDKLKTLSAASQDAVGCICTGSNLISVLLPKDTVPDADAVKEWLRSNQPEFVYKTSRVETIQLSPTEILALSGTNTIYTDTGDITVSGRADPNEVIKGLEDRIAALQGEGRGTMDAQQVLFSRALASTCTTFSDAQALSMPDILPTWEELLERGEKIQPGICLMHNGQCYRQAQSGEVTPEAHRPPGSEGMSAVYRPIVLGHAGTLEDPIPWVYEMDCEEGKYYSYKGKVYRVAVGGTMKPCLWPPDTPDFWQWEVVA